MLIDRFTKVADFITIKTTNSTASFVPLYIKEVLRLHSVPKFIVSGHDSKFVSIFR